MDPDRRSPVPRRSDTGTARRATGQFGPGAQSAQTGHTLLKVQGAIKFYAAAHDSLVGGVTRPYYRLRGQVDLTADWVSGVASEKASESVAWGSVKALFR